MFVSWRRRVEWKVRVAPKKENLEETERKKDGERHENQKMR